MLTQCILNVILGISFNVANKKLKLLDAHLNEKSSEFLRISG